MNKKYMLDIIKESNKIREEFIQKYWEDLILISNVIKESFFSSGKLLLIGNGGSAADCQHIAAEFINRFKIERKPLPAIALTTDSSIITSISNDYNFAYIFEKQILALGGSSDVLLAISTSGKSTNIIRGVKTAKEMGIYTVGFTGNNDGGYLPEFADKTLIVNSTDVARIQEVHIMVGHIICDIIDQIILQK